MWYVVVWVVAGCLMALWTFGAWALHAVTQWAAGLAGAKAAGAAGGFADAAKQLGTVKPPEWLAIWLPPGAQEQWGSLVSTLAPWVENTLNFAPSLAAWLSPAIWAAWALGAVLLLALGAGLSVLVRTLKQRRSSTSP